MDLRSPITGLWRRLANNPDYAWSLGSGYAQIAINILVQLLLVPLYLQYLDKVGFGVLMIVLATINYLGMGVSWVSAGAQRVMGEQSALDKREDLERTYGLSKIVFVIYAFVISASAWLIVWSMQESLFPNDPHLASDTLDMLAIGIAYAVVLYDLNVDRLVLISIAKQAWANVLSIISQLVFVACVVPLMMRGGGLAGVMAAFLMGVLVSRLVSFVLIRRHGLRLRWPALRMNAQLRRILGPMGIGYAAYGVLILTILQMDTLLLGILGGPALVADFVLVWKIADVAVQALWRLPETLVPYLIHMDTKGEHQRMLRVYETGAKWMPAMGALAGAGFALFGHDIVVLWVGPDHAPDLPWAYPLAGLGMFWMILARLPVIFAFSTVKLRPLIKVCALEVTGRLALVLVLFSSAGLYAPLIAMNAIHLFGIAYLYQRLRPDRTGEN